MAEQLLSPGSLLREVDKSIIPPQEPGIATALIGPTAKGKVNFPTLVTSYSDFDAKFGTSFIDGSGSLQTYLTSIAAYNYFREGGDSLLISRIAPNSGSGFTPASSTVTFSGSASDLFELETWAEGSDQNSATSLTKNNLTWSIGAVNPLKETFSVSIKRASDGAVLESFNGLSLDPLSDDYVAKRIGDIYYTVQVDADGLGYIESDGYYPNKSSFVRVKSVIAAPADITWVDFDTQAELGIAGTFSGGTGDIVANVADSLYDKIGTVTQGVTQYDYEVALSLMMNPDDFQYNVISTPGLLYEFHSDTIDALGNIIKGRGDAIYIIDLIGKGATITEVTAEAENIDNNYMSTYWPWAQLTEPELKKLVWVPASTLIPGTYKYNDITGETWSAPAGINRGGLSLVRQVERKLMVYHKDKLYQSNVNPIASFPGYGIVVYGQKTLQGISSILDRVNVRRLLIAVKSFVKTVGFKLTFEPSTIFVWNQFVNEITPYLESVKSKNGLYAYKVVMDDTLNTPDVIDRNELRGAVWVQPTKTAEFVYVDFIIQPQGTEFID